MSQKHCPDIGPLIGNPYGGRCGRWLKGEIHAHVCKDRANEQYSDGVSAATIYSAAKKACLDFVCMSVDVTLLHGGADRYGDVGAGVVNGVVGISGREIQNNHYSPEYFLGSPLADDDYFSESGADYLHILTIGDTGGVSICLHPRFYEIVKRKPGGCWTDIRSALLHPQSGGNLGQLNVSGIEIYNGLTLERLKSKGEAHKYSDYDEFCWDELLTEQRLYWGFAGNDSFFHHSDTFDRFSPLGVTYAGVEGDVSAAAIVSALKHGRFYSSTGIELSDDPISVMAEGQNVRIDVSATTAVDWTAKVLRQAQNGWHLDSQHVVNSSQATFLFAPEWKYIRIRAKSVQDPWQMAWLQPITNRNYFAV